MGSYNDSGFFKFFIGFVGVLAIGLASLVAVGFYQVEISGAKNISDPQSNF